MSPLPVGREGSSGVGAPVYMRHRPERTLLYQLVREYYPELKVQLAAQGTALPRYVKREFEAYLKCGRLVYLAGDVFEGAPLEQLQGPLIIYRIAVGPQQGRKVFTLQTLPACDEPFGDGVGQVFATCGRGGASGSMQEARTAVPLNQPAGGRGKKCVSGMVVGRIRVSGRHSQAMGEPVRRSTLGADGCEKGLRRPEKAVYASYKPTTAAPSLSPVRRAGDPGPPCGDTEGGW